MLAAAVLLSGYTVAANCVFFTACQRPVGPLLSNKCNWQNCTRPKDGQK